MISGTDHFGRREAAGIVVDLFWDRRDLRDEFRVEVEDRHDGTRFVLYPATGREAIQAFHHPFSSSPVLGVGRPARGVNEDQADEVLPACGRTVSDHNPKGP